MFNKLFTFGLLLSASLVSCVKQDPVPCNLIATIPGSAEITYSYTLHDYSGDLYDTRVNRVTTYIYDSAGYFYSEKVVTDPTQIKNGVPITLQLPVGRYTIVSWGGNSHLYQLLATTESKAYQSALTPGASRLSELRLGANIVAGQVASVDEFFGAGAADIVVADNATNHYSQAFTRNIHTLHLSIGGLSNLASETTSAIAFAVSGNNTRFRSDNSLDPSSGMVTYPVGEQTVSGDVASVTLPIFRFDENSSVRINVTNRITGNKIADFDLRSALYATPLFRSQNDLDREEEYSIAMTVNKNHTITIRVNGWEITNVGILQ